MQTFKRYIENLSVSQLVILSIILCIPAFLINLGHIAFIGDEAIRTLVALEMKLSGDFIVPTLNGEEYFNKPPLYNWFIYLTSSLFGCFGEWPTRITTLIFLGLFAWTVFIYVRKQFDSLTALIMALMLLTSGRILFWDSMLGLIDICFSLVIYLNFMVLYFLGKRQRWKSFFILSYLLFSVAFLLKGLPAVVFQGISIFAALALHGVFKRKIFSADHITGALIGILPVVMYYIAYASRVSIEHVFAVLLDQSMQRTGTHHGLWKTIQHVFTFPLAQAYHFLPWSLLVVMVFHPKSRSWINSNDFVRFNFWMLMANIPIYWLSVQVHPRYLLMFLPLFNLVGYYLLMRTLENNQAWWNFFRYTFIVFLGLIMIVMLILPFHEQTRSIPGIALIVVAGFIGLLFCFLCLQWDTRRSFIWFALALLILRSIFDMVVLPLRGRDYAQNVCRKDCLRVAQKWGDRPWYLYGETFPHEVARFYTSAYTHQIIRKTDRPTDPDAYYLVDRKLYPEFPGEQIDSLILESREVISLVKIDL